MANKEYIERLEQAIRRLYDRDSAHLETVHVRETLGGKMVWEGDIEVFVILGHRAASKCFAWSAADDNGDDQFTAVLAIPPVRSAADAVRASFVAKRTSDQLN